jgi:hypothetical protein
MENNKILTADEMYNKFDSKINPNWDEWDIEEIQNYAKEFAKMHVQKALEAAAENAKHIHKEYDKDFKIDKDSILNSYNLENIK